MQPFIAGKRKEIAELCRKHHVRRLSIFGSAVHDDFDPVRSDVDILVAFTSLEFPDYIANLTELRSGLEPILGRDVA